jgi:hypothetical protein
VLGGRIYLTADFYRERGAPLIAAGVVGAPVFDHIAADPRLDKLAEGDGEMAAWARGERDRRLMLRIMHGVPDAAKAAVVCTIGLGDGTPIVGCNWIGGTSKRDPVGEAEPTKTAETRAERRAWRRLVEVVPATAPLLVEAHAALTEANAAIPEAEITEVQTGAVGDLPRREPTHKPLAGGNPFDAETGETDDNGDAWPDSQGRA